MTKKRRARRRAQKADDRVALAHIRGRTISGKFAGQPWAWDERRWQQALARLRNGGHQIEWVAGQVADEPTVHGGWVLRASPRSALLSRTRRPTSRKRRLRRRPRTNRR
jgi:hypothetical protein